MFTLPRKRLARFGFALLVSLVSLCMTARQTLAAAGPTTSLAPVGCFLKAYGMPTPAGAVRCQRPVPCPRTLVISVRVRAFLFDGE